MGRAVRNVLAIGGKELRGYFASPIAWAIIGMFAFIFGWFYTAYLDFVVRNNLQAQFGGGPPSTNVNMDMIRPLLGNLNIIFLFIMPMVTMRTYSEEKRTGTIELLLTSPLTDAEIIVGKFLGAMGLYAAMMAVTLVYFGLLFFYGNPEIRPLVVNYLGVFLMGGCFVAIGLFISSLTKNQIVAAVGTFIIMLFLWVVSWMADSAGPTLGGLLSYLSITEHFDDFAKGVLDTKHIVYYASVISFGLFLTAKSVDSERWRG